MSSMRINTMTGVRDGLFDFTTAQGRLQWLLKLLCVNPEHYKNSAVCKAAVDKQFMVLEDFMCDAQLISYDTHLAALRRARERATIISHGGDPDAEYP